MKRSRTVRLEEISSVDWARLAAYVDGEGCIGISLHYVKRRVKRYRAEHMYVNVVNTDPRLIAWCFTTFGGCLRESKRPDRNHRNMSIWQVSADQAAEILEHCLPYFLIKREQAEIALAFQLTRLKRGGQKGCGKGQQRISAEVEALRDQYHTEIKRLRREEHPSLSQTLDSMSVH